MRHRNAAFMLIFLGFTLSEAAYSQPLEACVSSNGNLSVAPCKANETPVTIGGGRQIGLFDADGNLLGIPYYNQFRVFNEALGLTVDNSTFLFGGTSSSLSSILAFTSTDCTGPPYVGLGSLGRSLIGPLGPDSAYYVTTLELNSEPIAVGSYFNFGSGCQPSSYTWPPGSFMATEAYSGDIPFPVPARTPFYVAPLEEISQ